MSIGAAAAHCRFVLKIIDCCLCIQIHRINKQTSINLVSATHNGRHLKIYTHTDTRSLHKYRHMFNRTNTQIDVIPIGVYRALPLFFFAQSIAMVAGNHSGFHLNRRCVGGLCCVLQIISGNISLTWIHLRWERKEEREKSPHIST